ncbi:DNA primase DnaG, partial [Nanoarchaeota archaeon]
ELQRSGRIGRIEVAVDTKSGKTQGNILIPSSLDMAETSIVGAALEIIQRIGPCNAKLKVAKIEDVRVSKRLFVIERAKELLKQMQDTTMPDSQELADEVACSVRVMEIREYGKDRLPAGPAIDESDEIIIVEGRADVLTLLKQGFKNAIAMNGTSVPQTIIALTKQKVVTVFVDGDRGGNMIVKELMQVAEIDFVTRAPDGKEVEELAKKEIHKALRSKVSIEQAKLDFGSADQKAEAARSERRPSYQRQPYNRSQQSSGGRFQRRSAPPQPQVQRAVASVEEKKTFKKFLEDLIGTRGAYVLDKKLSILGKVPLSELASTIKSLSTGVYAIVFDGDIISDLVKISEQVGLKYIVGMDNRVKPTETRISMLTINDL